MKKVKIGVVGCGCISDIYLTNLTTVFNNIVEVKAVCDLIPEREQQRAEQYGIPHIYKHEQLWNDPEIQIILNITTPDAHFEVANDALNAGKSVHNEKPLSIELEDGRKLKAKAAAKGLLLGGAPDTFMGAGIQTCIKLINDGWIGTPIAATAYMVGHGHESWHPDPEFYYQVGGGPMFDMGPYYLTALISMLGSIDRVTGSARITFPTRTITSEKKYGEIIDVEVPTHIAGIMDFSSGAIGTIITSFDVWGANLPKIEIYGSEGTLSVPDPNNFGGPVKVKRFDSDTFIEMPLTHSYTGNSRGLGVADMAMALTKGRKNRSNGDVAFHVLEAMHGFHIASETGRHYAMTSTCERPAPMPMGLLKGQMD